MSQESGIIDWDHTQNVYSTLPRLKAFPSSQLSLPVDRGCQFQISGEAIWLLIVSFHESILSSYTNEFAACLAANSLWIAGNRPLLSLLHKHSTLAVSEIQLKGLRQEHHDNRIPTDKQVPAVKEASSLLSSGGKISLSLIHI